MIKLADILTEQESKITDLFIGQARPKFNSDSLLQNISTAGEKIASKLLTIGGAIDIEVTSNMSTNDVINKIKVLAVKGVLVPGKLNALEYDCTFSATLNTITISAHGTGCGKFNYDIMQSSGANQFWDILAKFCNSNTKIFLGGCSVAREPQTVSEIAKITNCTVTAPSGLYAPATGVVAKTKDSFNLTQQIGKYITCTNNPTGDTAKYRSFIYGNLRDLFDPRTNLSVGRMMSIIKDFRDDLNYISPASYEKLNQNQTNEKLISTIIEQFTIRLIKDYVKSLGCYASKTNPIQSTRQAIFK